MRPINGLVVSCNGMRAAIEMENGLVVTVADKGWRLYDRVNVFYDFTRKEVRNIELFIDDLANKEMIVDEPEVPQERDPDEVEDDTAEILELTGCSAALALTGDYSACSARSASVALTLTGERSGSSAEDLELLDICDGMLGMDPCVP
jgi:hypothetical protein